MNQALSGQLVSHTLLPLESSLLLMEEPGIAAITFYEGNIDSIAQFLHKRLAALLKVNPWLTGRIGKQKNSKKLQLTYNRYFNEDVAASQIFNSKPSGLILNPSDPYLDLCKKASVCLVNKGRVLVRNQEALVKLSLVPAQENPENKFALIFSISHIVADGYTFYTLLNSLFGNVEPPALEPGREIEASKKIPFTVGEKEYKYIFSTKFLLNAMKGFLFGRNPEIYAHYIDVEKIDNIKRDFKQRQSDPDAFISTNDILTSGFIRAVRSRLCMCAINLRNRVDAIGFLHAGNYEAALLFDDDKAQSPQGVRATLNDGPPFEPTSKPLPNFWSGISCRMGLITNWATFTGDLSLPDCEQILHLPLHATPNKMPFDCAIVFEPKPGQTAMIVFAKSVSLERIGESCLFGKTVFESNIG